MRERIEYWLVLAVARTLGRLPRALARGLVGILTGFLYLVLGRLRHVGERNLELAMPHAAARPERNRILRTLFRNLGWQLVEFCRMPRYTAENTARTGSGPKDWSTTWPRRRKAKGCWCLPATLARGNFSGFYHSLMGHRMGVGDPALSTTGCSTST